MTTARFLLLCVLELATLLPLQAEPERGPGIGAGIRAVGALEAVDQKPADPLDQPVITDTRRGGLHVLTVNAPSGARLTWLVEPPDAGLYVDSNGMAAVLGPSAGGAYAVNVVIHTADADLVARLVVIHEGPTPGPAPGPGPIPIPVSTLADKVRGFASLVPASPTKADEQKRLSDSFAVTAAQIGAGVLTTVEQITAASKAANALAVPRDKWLPFFTALNAELQARFKSGERDYAAMWQAVSEGLK